MQARPCRHAMYVCVCVCPSVTFVHSVEMNKHIIIIIYLLVEVQYNNKQNRDDKQQEVKVIWQKAPHGEPIHRLGVTPGGRKLYHWIPGVGFPISVP